MLKNENPITRQRNKLIRMLTDRQVSASSINKTTAEMRGKTEEEKERIAEKLLKEVEAGLWDETKQETVNDKPSVQINRQEKLNTLRRIDFHMSVQDGPEKYSYDVLTFTNRGVRSTLLLYNTENYLCWYIYKLRSVTQENWNSIREKIKNKTLAETDLVDTDFWRLYRHLKSHVYGIIFDDSVPSELLDINRLFNDLVTMPNQAPDVLFGFVKDDYHLKFCGNLDDLKRNLIEKRIFQPDALWDELEDDEVDNLYEWYMEDLEEKLPDVLFTTFDE